MYMFTLVYLTQYENIYLTWNFSRNFVFLIWLQDHIIEEALIHMADQQQNAYGTTASMLM